MSDKVTLAPKTEVVSLEEMTARWQRTEEERCRLQEKFDSLHRDYKSMQVAAESMEPAAAQPSTISDKDIAKLPIEYIMAIYRYVVRLLGP
jgi:predicted nuclease with TOPRIM domain